MGGVQSSGPEREKGIVYSRVEVATQLNRSYTHTGGSSMDHGTLSSLELRDQKESLEGYIGATQGLPHEPYRMKRTSKNQRYILQREQLG